jgi:hypothetical protein
MPYTVAAAVLHLTLQQGLAVPRFTAELAVVTRQSTVLHQAAAVLDMPQLLEQADQVKSG